MVRESSATVLAVTVIAWSETVVVRRLRVTRIGVDKVGALLTLTRFPFAICIPAFAATASLTGAVFSIFAVAILPVFAVTAFLPFAVSIAISISIGITITNFDRSWSSVGRWLVDSGRVATCWHIGVYK